VIPHPSREFIANRGIESRVPLWKVLECPTEPEQPDVDVALVAQHPGTGPMTLDDSQLGLGERFADLVRLPRMVARRLRRVRKPARYSGDATGRRPRLRCGTGCVTLCLQATPQGSSSARPCGSTRGRLLRSRANHQRAQWDRQWAQGTCGFAGKAISRQLSAVSYNSRGLD